MNREPETPYQEFRRPSMNLYSALPGNGLAPSDVDPAWDQTSQGDILSQHTNQPLTAGYDMQPIISPMMAYSPGQNNLWPQSTQSARGTSQNPRYLENSYPRAFPSAELQQRSALQQTCTTHRGSTLPLRHLYCHRCSACISVVWEPNPIVPQLARNPSTWVGTNFSIPSSSVIRGQTVPEHSFNNDTPSEGVTSQHSGSFLIRETHFVPD